MLGIVKSIIVENTGDQTPPRHYLVTKVLLDQLEASFQDYARRMYDPEHPEFFICLIDTAYGIGAALDLLRDATVELYGGSDYRTRLHIDPTGTADPPVFSVTNDFDEYARAKRVVAALDRLEQEPSGFSVLDECVAEIHEEYTNRRNGHLIIASAEMAQKLYKALYPLTEGI